MRGVRSTSRLVIAVVVALALGNGLAVLAGIGANELLPRAELGPTVMRALLATAVTFTLVVAIVLAAFERPWLGRVLAAIVGGAVVGLVLAAAMLLLGGLQAEDAMLFVVLAVAQALVIGGALLGRRLATRA